MPSAIVGAVDLNRRVHVGSVIAVSSAHSCVVTVGGRVECFGSDDGGKISFADHRNDYVSVAVTWHTTCALNAQGAILCW